MQIAEHTNEPTDDILLRENDITITGTRLDINNKTYALHYISTVTLDESHPPRGEALFVIVVAVLAIVMSILYAVTGKLTLWGFLVFSLLSLCAFVIGILVYRVDPSRYSLKLKMVNGEEVSINSKSESFIQRVHQALTRSLALSRQSPAPHVATAISSAPSTVSSTLPASSQATHAPTER